MMTRALDRRGAALAAVLFTLTVIAALLAGSFFQSAQEMRSGSARQFAARAMAGADFGVEQTIATWDRRWTGLYARGFGFAHTITTADGAAIDVHLLRLSDELFLVGAEARDGAARRASGRLVRLAGPQLVPAAVLTAAVPLDLAMAVVDPIDHVATADECPETGPPITAVLVADTAAHRNPGGISREEIASWATVRPIGASTIDPAPHSLGASCHIDEPSNWGEPRKQNGGPCTSHYPIIHVTGDLRIAGGRGQGLLLVDGNLDVTGAFEFAGVVIVRGSVRVRAATAHIRGAMQITDGSGAASDLRGLTVEWSRCAVSKALLTRATPQRVPERSWFAAHGLR